MRVLIVDDDNQNLGLFRHLIQEFFDHVQVIEADNGQHAVSLAREYAPRLILMDIEMPVMNGLEALKILKSEPRTSDIPIVTVTGNSTGRPEEDRRRFLSEGFAGYIRKPVRIEEFLTEVTKHIPDHNGDRNVRQRGVP